MATVRLSKREHLECMAEALRIEAPGAKIRTKYLLLIDAKCLDNISRKTFYNHMEYLEVDGKVEAVKKQGYVIRT